jgi:uncharacterized membrane protein YbhN (UPF0104 family)
MRKKIEKIISYTIVFLIFFFLARGLISDLRSLERIEYDFRWGYLLSSAILFFISIPSFGLVWRKIYSVLDPTRKISIFNTVKIYIYSQFGRYLPGKAWAYVGMVYLGDKEGLQKEYLTASVVYEIALSVAAAFIFPFLILSFQPQLLPAGLSYYPFLLVALGLVCLHPAIFYRLFGWLLKILKMENLPKDAFLKFWDLLKIIFYYLIVLAINGAAFYMFASAFFNVPGRDILNFAAFFILASALGMVAVFAPSGLGVREGFLALFLRHFLTLSAGIFISLVVRVWVTLIEVLMFLVIYLWAGRHKAARAPKST